MTLVSRGSVLGHAIAVGGVAGLVLLHGIAGQPASADVLLPSLLTVIVIAGWLGGFAPALVGTLLASLVTAVALPPRGFLAVTPAGALRLAVLAGCGLLVALLARWAHRRARAAHEEAARVRDREARFQLATEAVQGVVYDLDFRTGEWWSSEGITRIVGSRPPGPTAPQSWWMDRIHPDDRARLAAGFARVAASGEPTWSGRYRVRHDDGRWVHVWDNARLLRDATGGIVRIVGYSVDVSAEVAAQEALRRSEERFQLATSVVRGVMYDVDLPSGHTWRSEGLRELIGLPPDAAEATPAWWLARMHPDDQARFGRSEIDPALARLDNEYRVRHEDGHWVQVWDRMRIVHDEDGRPIRAVGYTMDVSALHEAREARRAADERLRLAIDGAGMGAWEVDAATDHVVWSDSFFRMLGYAPAAGGAGHLDLLRERLHPDDRDAMLATFEASRRSGTPYRHEYRIRRADDGAVRRISSIGRHELDDAGRAVRSFGITFDVTEREEAQEALRQRAEELEGLLALLPAAVWYAHDPAATAITGNAFANRIVPPMAADDPLVPPPAHPGFPRVLRDGAAVPVDALPLHRAAATGEAADGVELTIELGDGARVELLGGATPLFGPDGRPRGAVGAFVDITERKRIESELRDARRLFEKIADATPGILYLYDLVEQRNVYANRGLTTVLGYTPEELAGMGGAMGSRLVHPDDLEAGPTSVAAFGSLGPDGVREHVLRMRHVDGAWRHLRCRETVFSRDDDGTPRLMLGIAHDVTEELATVAALTQSEERLRLSLATAHAMVFEWDIRADRVVNEALLPILGPLPGDLPLERALGTVHPDDRAAVRDRIARAVRGETAEYLSEHRVVAPEGEPERWVLVRGAVRRDEAGAAQAMTGIVMDVTARHEAEAAAREAERRFASAAALLDTLFENAPVAMAVVDRDFRHVRVNERGAAYANLPRERIIGRTVAEISPEFWPALEPLYRRALAGEPVLGLEVTGHGSSARADEPPGTYLASYYPVRTGDGEVIGVGLIVNDITVRKHAEERLRESERRLRELADAMPQIVFVNRADGSLEYVNRQWEAYTGEPYESDSRVHERVHADDRDRMLAAWDASRTRGEPYESEFRMLGRDGAYRWFLSRAVPVRDEHGAVVRWYGTSTNIDEQKRAQAALQHGEARQRDLADAALRINASLSVAKPLRDTLQLVTDRARDIVGAHQALLMASHEDHDGQTVHAVSLGEKYARFRDYDEPVTGKGIYALVSRHNRPMRLTQAELEAHPAFTRFRDARREHPPLRGWLAVPLLGRDGRNLGILQFSDKRDGGDFTAEDEAVATQMAAMAAVGMENWALVEQIRDADRRKDEFLATLAHELRNPLAPISNSLELLRRAPADPAILSRASGTMERQMGQMVRLIDDLLDASRISRGKLVLRPQRVTLESVVTQAVETARPHLEAAGHALEVTLPPEPVWLDADPTRLAQVFGNLLNNASKYSPPRSEVRVDARCRDGRVEVRVTDTGIGIPADKLGSIFEMFSQVDRSLERTSGGLGIGLALVRGLVEMHGGSVEARSAGPGLGSAFTVSLPVSLAPEPFDQATDGPGAPVAGRRRILVADDNRDGADSLAALLRRSGHEVHVVYDGEDAVEAARRLQPHVALLDLGMPRLNGHDAAQAIRALPGGQQMTLVALTGWGDEATRRRTRESGFDGHLTKPVDYPTLLGLIGALTEARGAAST